MRLTSNDDKDQKDDDSKESFFDFFSPPCVYDEDGNLDTDVVDEDTMEILVEDYEMGEIIKDQIIPNAINYFFDEVDVDGDYSEVFFLKKTFVFSYLKEKF